MDCGASISIITKWHTTRRRITPSNKTPKMWNGTEMKLFGTTRLKFTNPKTRKKYSIEFVVVPDDLTLLLGARTAQQMELITVHEGVRRSIIPWICSFLTDRWQCVKLVQTVSNWLACLLACLLTYLLTYMGTSSSGPVWAKQERVHDHSAPSSGDKSSGKATNSIEYFVTFKRVVPRGFISVDLKFNFLNIDHHLCVYFSCIAGYFLLFNCMDRWFHCDNGEEFVITRFIAVKLRLLRKPMHTTRLALFANRGEIISAIAPLTSLLRCRT